ncbi:MAG: tRNA dihydrouridine synthase DusB [bacterium]
MRRDLTLGNLQISPALALAPMAGITNSPFRLVCRRGGAGLVFTEMISARAMKYQSRRTAEMGVFLEEEHPVAAQIFGREPEEMADAAMTLTEAGADIIDINMGCPVRKVLKSGSGIQLMREPDLAADIVKAVTARVDVPVTVKIRLGWSEKESNFITFGKILADSGTSAVILHPRTRAQGFAGSARWEEIARLAEALDIPVLGSGDVATVQDARTVFETTDCGGILIGRGSLGRPWIFSQIAAELEGEEPGRDDELRKQFISMHIKLIEKALPDRRSIGHLRKHLAWYSRGLPDGSSFRVLVNSLDSSREIADKAAEFFGLEGEKIIRKAAP